MFIYSGWENAPELPGGNPPTLRWFHFCEFSLTSLYSRIYEKICQVFHHKSHCSKTGKKHLPNWENVSASKLYRVARHARRERQVFLKKCSGVPQNVASFSLASLLFKIWHNEKNLSSARQSFTWQIQLIKDK